MRPYARTLLSLLIAALCFGSAAHAQQPERPRQRSGYYISYGLSGAMTRWWQDDADAKWETDGATMLRFGQMLTSHFGLGLRLGVNFKSQFKGPDYSQLGVLGIEGQWEFARHFALRAGVGLGLAILEKDKSDPDADQKGTVGAGYSLLLSYDWFVGVPTVSGGFSLTPLVEARLVPGSDLSALTVLVGLEFTYWTGLPRDQLILPENEAYRRR